MAGMIYDANESLNWILDDPNMKEAFRNSSMIGSSIVCSSDFRASRHGSKTAPLSDKRKDISNKQQESSTHSLANLFNDDEERELLGIGLFTIWEAGVLVSGYGGTGIVLSRNVMTGDWSGPVAVGVSGIGAGVLLGASMKTIVYLIYDYFTLQSIIGTDGGLIFRFGAGATIGTWTKDTGKQTAYITSPKMLRTAGLGSNVALCRGLAGMYGAMSVEAGICKCRDRINAQFYGNPSITGADILLSGEAIDIPNQCQRGGSSHSNTKKSSSQVSNYHAKRLLEKIHSKLERLCNRDGSDHGVATTTSKLSSKQPKDPKTVRDTLEELYADETYGDLDDDSGETKQEEDLEETKKEHERMTVVEATPLSTEPEAQ